MKGATNTQISFKLHNAKDEQCCSMTFVSSLPLMVFSLVYLRGKVGHKENKTKLWKFFWVTGKNFKWNICCTHRPQQSFYLQSPLFKWCSFDAPSHSLKDSNVSLKVKIKEKIVGVCFLTRNTSGVKGCAGALGWGLTWVISLSIIHTYLHKPNNELVSGLLEHFLCTDESWTYIDSQNSPQFKLGGSHHLPPYNIIWD